MAWSVRMAARMARAWAFSPLAGRGAWVPCGGMSPSWEGAWWRSALLTKDVSGSVEKVMVRLPSRCTLIKSQWVLATPTGSLLVLERGAMTKGGDDQAQPPYATST